jgi:hypothetical protein
MSRGPSSRSLGGDGRVAHGARYSGVCARVSRTFFARDG